MRILSLLLIVLLVACTEPKPKSGALPSATSVEPKQEKYLNEGTVTFHGKDGASVITFELANTPREIEKGLMYRKHMPDSVGMVFKFPYPDMRSFWMKNTHISLDIIFVNELFEIVNIEEYAQPFSQYSLPSTAPAMYVIEVNAGYSKKHGLGPGTKLEIDYAGS